MTSESAISTFSGVYEKISDCIATKKEKKKNTRLSIMETMFSLSSLPIAALEKSCFEMNVTDLYSNISCIYKKMETSIQNYINNNIYYIKQPKDNWIQEFLSFQQHYNDFTFLYNNKFSTPEDIRDLVSHLIEIHNLLYEIFNEKYQQTFK